MMKQKKNGTNKIQISSQAALARQQPTLKNNETRMIVALKRFNERLEWICAYHKGRGRLHVLWTSKIESHFHLL
jgi:hypothetical protein